ncbi:MAG: PilZ domain-containing protein [Nevskia sp.]|nr:PilZ domain-containing protein [Nevskia sp.]
MQQAAKTEAADALSYRDRLPLEWVPLPALPEGLEAERLADSNARLLQTVELLGDHAHTQPSDDPTATEIELQRIHQKLNLLLELVGGFMRLQTQRPPAVPLRLSWRGVTWEGHGLPLGSTGLVEIHLSSVLPMALRWPATIVASEPGQVRAEFASVSEFCQAALERHVFQRHRREVAEKRQPDKQAG